MPFKRKSYDFLFCIFNIYFIEQHNNNDAMMLSKIPIFITVRANCDETFEINKEALKFSYLFIKDAGMFEQTYIISDNKKMLKYAEALGFTNTIHYPCGNEKDLLYLEYLATYRYGIEHNYHPDWIILLNVRQIFKQPSLLRDCINNIDDKYDIVASYTSISNKSNFFVDEALLKEDKDTSHLLTSKHQRVKMVDSAIYAVKSDFAFKCMEYDDPSKYFWNGKIKYFENNSLYTDIFNLSDIYKYYEVADTIDKIKEIEQQLDDTTVSIKY